MSSSVNVSGLSWRLNRSPEIKTLSKTETRATHFSQVIHMKLHFLLGYDKCKIKGKIWGGGGGGLSNFIHFPASNPFSLISSLSSSPSGIT